MATASMETRVFAKDCRASELPRAKAMLTAEASRPWHPARALQKATELRPEAAGVGQDEPMHQTT